MGLQPLGQLGHLWLWQLFDRLFDFRDGTHRAVLPSCETQEKCTIPQFAWEPSPLFVPAGTPENSPPLQRWDQRISPVTAPAGATDTRTMRVTPPPISRASAVPDGTWRFDGIALPPLKRWAIFGCPCRDKTRSFRKKHSPGKPWLISYTLASAPNDFQPQFYTVFKGHGEWQEDHGLRKASDRATQPHRCTGTRAKRSFADIRSQAELGTETMRVDSGATGGRFGPPVS